MIPFLIPRLYRPLMLECWHISNTDLGVAFSVYGLLAMISYILGGPFADKYNPRTLISSSLFITAIGSLYLALFPSKISLIVTYGFFGVSTILLLWGALIKVTHLAGGEERRSIAMGVLDSGRGLSAAIVSSLLVFIVSFLYPELESNSDQLKALTTIYFLTASFTILIGIFVWVSLDGFNQHSEQKTKWSVHKATDSLKNSQVWLLSIIVLSSYCGYKSIDNYSIYIVDVHDKNLSESSFFTSIIFWLRPISALITGLAADKWHQKNNSGRFLLLLVLLFASGFSQLLLVVIGQHSFYYAFTVVLSASAFAYALRAIYFSVFGDLNIPTHLIGTTVGIVSFIGFLPDVFFGLITGKLIDSYPGAIGFNYVFIFTAICLLLGAVASYLLYRNQLKSS